MVNNKKLKRAEDNMQKFAKELLREIEHILDNSSWDGVQDLDKRSYQLFCDKAGKAANELKTECRNNQAILSLLNCDKEHIERRAKAISEYAKPVKERYGEKYPKLDIVESFVGINAGSSLITYDVLFRNMYLDHAAAFWILDELCHNGNIHKAMNYFPPEEKAEEWDVCELFDASHEKRAINSMLYIIRHRNDYTGENPYTIIVDHETTVNSSEREYVMTEPGENITGRQRFDSVISLINPQIIKYATERFEAKIWEALDIFLDCLNYYWEKEASTLIELKKNTNELMQVFERVRTVRQTVNIMAPLVDPEQNSRANLKEQNITADRQTKILEKGLMLEDLRNEYEAKIRGIKYICSNLSAMGDFRAEDVMLDEEIVEKLKSLRVEDPFETCFALFYLLDNGSNLPWLYSQGMAVAHAAFNQLPWAFEDESDSYLEPGDEEAEYQDVDDTEDPPDIDEEIPDEEVEAALIDHVSDNARYYEMRYDNRWDMWDADTAQPDRIHKMNYAQIIYQMTGVVLPRDMWFYHGLGQDLERSGFSEDEGRITEILFAMGDAARFRSYYSNRFDYGDLSANMELTAERKLSAAEDDLEKIKQQFEQLKELYHEEHREKNILIKKLTEVSRENESLKQENRELRDTANPVQSGDTALPELQETIEFPYHATYRHVVFGGHASWTKVIRTLLKNVRFVSADAKPDVSLIKNADTVWIQNNAISHADYYKIINIVRANNIPVEYFSYASAEKCADQLARYDMEL